MMMIFTIPSILSMLYAALFIIVCTPCHETLTAAASATGPVIPPDSSIHYNIVSRRPERSARSEHTRRGLQLPPDDQHQDDTFLSFDGDLDRIVQLALERANAFAADQQEDTDKNTAAPTVTPVPTVTPAPSTSMAPSSPPIHSPNVCEGAILNRMIIHEWQYTVETVEHADIDAVVGEVEEILQRRLVPLILQCYNAEVAPISIVAVDATLPRDNISTTTVCAPETDPSHRCTAIDGTIRLFLSDPGRASDANSLTSTMIKVAVEAPGFVEEVGLGLIKITILDDNIPIPTNPIVEEETPRVFDGATGFGTISFVIVAIGGAAIIAFVGSVYYWRKGGNDHDGAATQAAATMTFINESHDLGSPRPSSPFSEMLPSAYRFNDNMSILLTGQGGMSPVIEDDGSVSQQSSAAFSDLEGQQPHDSLSFDMPKSIYAKGTSSPELLGARKRAGGALTAGMHLYGNSESDDTDQSVGNNTSDDINVNTDDGDANTSISNPFQGLLGFNLHDPSTPVQQDLDLLFDHADVERGGEVEEEKKEQEDVILKTPVNENK